MLSLKILLLLLVGICNIIMAILVLTRGVKKPSNRSYFLASMAMTGWVIGVACFLLTDDLNIAFVIAKIYYSFPLLIGVGLVFFALTFAGDQKINTYIKTGVLLGLFALLVPLVVQRDFLTVDVVRHEWGKEVLLNKLHYLFYSAYLFLTYGGTLLVTYVKSKKERGLYAAQANMFFWGFLITFIIGTGFNLILPWFGNYRLIWIGPYCTAIFMVAIAYSIIKHHMFNIRSVIARSSAYILSLSVLIIIYTSLIYSMARLLDNDTSEASLGTNMFNAALLAVMVPVYVPVKRFFDRATSRVFYRDAYEPQVLINELNEILVKTTKTTSILKRVSELLENTLKVYKVGFVILPTEEGGEAKYFGDKTVSVPRAELTDLSKSLISASRQSFYAEEPEEGKNSAVYEFMNQYEWAAAARLATRTQKVGFILVGYKLSGSSFMQQDKNLLDIVSDELALAIQNSLRHEEIDKFNETLQQEVDDATKQLRHTNEKLKALDETKDEFISMASHQLRTPLTSVKGYLSMVLDGDAGKLNGQQDKLLRQAFISSQRMNYLISDLLHLSRMRTGKFVIEASPTNLVDIVQSELEQLSEAAAARGLKINFVKPDNFPILELDETKIRQVIMNFIDNAIYYTPDGGKIDIILEASRSRVEFKVVDTGLGVPKADQHKLFNKFFRADNARRARPDGTGLGLFMAKKVIIAQGGAIIFRSIEGKGSTFGFVFPLKQR